MMRYHGSWIGAGIVFAALAMTGCEPSAETGGDMDSLAAQLEQSKQAAAAAAAAEQAKLAAEKVAAELAAQEAAKQAALAAQPAPVADNETSITITVKNPQGLLNGMRPGDETTKTTAGAGTVGQGGGYYSAIAAAHRHITTRVDDLAWMTAVKSYWAEQGHYPKSHEEFMKCLATYDTQLPALEEGEEYLYDPNEGDFGTLYVVTQQPQQPPATAPPTE